METLILSCSTGGGHNAAASALKEELECRGHSVTVLDPYSLVGKNLDRRVGKGYVRLVQKRPKLFGRVYQLGDLYRQLPLRSPVYAINHLMCRVMQKFLEQHSFDVIFMSHIYPGEILANMKNKGILLPKTIFVATDYTCIPFTEELTCDYYITPSPEINADFSRWGIPAERLMPMGIPVRREFCTKITRSEAAEALGLDTDKHYILLSGGSIGAGGIEKSIRNVSLFLDENPDYRLIVVCGNNKKLFSGLREQYAADERIKILSSTDQMALYMKASDMYLSKPGGLSSTEAAVMGVPLIHLAPIPGCETKNMEYFSSRGMSRAAENDLKSLGLILEEMKDPQYTAQMLQKQKEYISSSAAADICDLAERLIID